MRSWTFHILAMLSLALLIGSAILWVRSVRTSDQLAYRSDGSVTTLMTAPHGLALQRSELPRSGVFAVTAANVMSPQPGWSGRSVPWGPSVITSAVGSQGRTTLSIQFTVSLDNAWVEPVNSLLGFGWETRPRPLLVVVPFWFLVIALSIAPAVWARRVWRQRVRQRTGLCPRCGYDLRATPGRCPECGHEVAVDSQADGQPVESADP